MEEWSCSSFLLMIQNNIVFAFFEFDISRTGGGRLEPLWTQLGQFSSVHLQLGRSEETYWLHGITSLGVTRKHVNEEVVAQIFGQSGSREISSVGDPRLILESLNIVRDVIHRVEESLLVGNFCSREVKKARF